MNKKKCYCCKKENPETLEYFRFDKRRGCFYASCIECVNNKRRENRLIKRIGQYDSDAGIKKRARDYSLSGKLLETQRLRLILLDRIKNKSHIIFDGNHFRCNVCNINSVILTPISVDLLNEALIAFKKAHIHE